MKTKQQMREKKMAKEILMRFQNERHTIFRDSANAIDLIEMTIGVVIEERDGEVRDGMKRIKDEINAKEDVDPNRHTSTGNVAYYYVDRCMRLLDYKPNE